jgi:hypothetical protein
LGGTYPCPHARRIRSAFGGCSAASSRLSVCFFGFTCFVLSGALRRGLSYTNFSYAWAGANALAEAAATHEIAGGANIQYECTVQNIGKVAGAAVVLGFVNSSDPQFPRQKLFDFERVFLRPGESATVLLTVNADHLTVVDDEGRRWLRPASFGVRVGDVVAPATHAFALLGNAVMIEDLSGVWPKRR